jgi:hypothetical protein
MPCRWRTGWPLAIPPMMHLAMQEGSTGERQFPEGRCLIGYAARRRTIRDRPHARPPRCTKGERQ